MRVGVIILPQFTAAVLALRWRSLEDRGFAHGWTYDHLAWRELAEQPWYSTMSTLTVAAAATTTLRLGTWVSSPNFRHPVPYAKDLMSLDDVAGGDRGRLIAAIGAGGLGWDAAVLGRPELSPRHRVDRLTEFAELTDLLLRQGETTWRGQYFVAERARMYPAGSRSRIAMVLAGSGARSIRLAAAYDGWATTGPTTPDLSAEQWWTGLGEQVRTFEQAAADLGRDPAAAERYLSIDLAPGSSFADVDVFLRAAARARDLGFTDVVVHWPRAEGIYAGDEALLDRIADRLEHGQLRL